MPFRNGQWIDEGDFAYGDRFREGYDRTMKRGALGDARRAYDEGNYDEAARVAAPYDPDAAETYRAEGTRAYSRDYARAYGEGDYAGAQSRAAQRGDLQGVETARTGQRTREFQNQLGAVRRYQGEVRRIGALPDAQREQAWQDLFARAEAESGGNPQDLAAVQQLKAQFPTYSPEAHQALEQTLSHAFDAFLSNDPKAYLDNLQAQAEQALAERKIQTDEARLEETERHNREVEANTVAAITARGANSQNSQLTQQEQRDFTRAGTIRDDYRAEPVVKGYQEIRNVYNRSQAYLNRIGPNGRGAPVDDIGLVFALAKINDPTSVVREQEFAQIASSGGYGQQFRNWVNQASGRGFDPATRRQLVTAIESAYKAYGDTFAQTQREYAELARRYGLDPSDVVLGYQEAATPAEGQDNLAPTLRPPPSPPAPTTPAPPSRSFSTLPPAQAMRGKTIRDTGTNPPKRYYSDGVRWTEVR